MIDNLVRLEDLVNNPTARIPVCLCLDVSISMADNDKIGELNRGIELFYEAIREDEVALYSAEVSVVTFNDNANQLVDFAGLELQPTPPRLVASGSTAMGEGVNLALDLLEQRKKEYQDKGVDYYQPWLILMTDGAPNGSAVELSRAISRTTSLVQDKKLTVFPIGIGNDANLNVLGQFSPNRPPLKLQGLKFKEFFIWLSQSVSKVSQSSPGEKVNLDLEAIKAWGTLD